jgi:hypothetical protein
MAAAREGKVNQMLDELTSLRAHVEVMRKKLALSKDIEALNLGSASQHCCGSTCNTQHTHVRQQRPQSAAAFARGEAGP